MPLPMMGNTGTPDVLGALSGRPTAMMGGPLAGPGYQRPPMMIGMGPGVGGAGAMEPFIAQYLSRLQSMGPQRVAQDQMFRTGYMPQPGVGMGRGAGLGGGIDQYQLQRLPWR